MVLSLLVGLGIQAAATITLCDEEIKLDALLNHVAVSKGLELDRTGIPNLWMNVRVDKLSAERFCGAIEAATGGRITTDERQLRFKLKPQLERHELARRELNDALVASQRVLGFGFKYLKGRIEELEERFRDRPARLYDTDPIWLADSKELSQLRRFDKPASYAFARTQIEVGKERIRFIPSREAIKYYDEARGGVSDTKVDPIFIFINHGAPQCFYGRGAVPSSGMKHWVIIGLLAVCQRPG